MLFRSSEKQLSPLQTFNGIVNTSRRQLLLALTRSWPLLASDSRQQQALLKKAVETAPKMILALRQLGRPDGRQLYYKDRRYQNT